MHSGNEMNKRGVLIPLLLTLTVLYFLDTVIFVLPAFLTDTLEKSHVGENRVDTYRYDIPKYPLAQAVLATIINSVFLWCAGHYMTADVRAIIL